MDPGLGFAVLSALVWGGYIYFLKRSFTQYPPAALVVLANSFALLWYAPILAVRRRRIFDASQQIGASEVGILLLTAGMTAAALLLFLRALERGAVSYVTPINKIVPVFVLPLEIGLLGAVLRPLQVCGVVVATLAVYVANYEPGEFLQPFVTAARSRPAQLALASACCFAVGDLGKRIGLQELAVPSQLWIPSLLAAVVVLLLPAAIRNPPRMSRAELPKFALIGGFVAAGESLATLAFALLPASIASPIINTQAVIAVVLGGVLLDEQHFRLRLLAAALAVFGVALLSL